MDAEGVWQHRGCRARCGFLPRAVHRGVPGQLGQAHELGRDQFHARGLVLLHGFARAQPQAFGALGAFVGVLQHGLAFGQAGQEEERVEAVAAYGRLQRRDPAGEGLQGSGMPAQAVLAQQHHPVGARQHFCAQGRQRLGSGRAVVRAQRQQHARFLEQFAQGGHLPHAQVQAGGVGGVGGGGDIQQPGRCRHGAVLRVYLATRKHVHAAQRGHALGAALQQHLQPVATRIGHAIAQQQHGGRRHRHGRGRIHGHVRQSGQSWPRTRSGVAPAGRGGRSRICAAGPPARPH